MKKYTLMRIFSVIMIGILTTVGVSTYDISAEGNDIGNATITPQTSSVLENTLSETISNESSNKDGKHYIITAKSKKAYNQVKKEYKECLDRDPDTLESFEDNNILLTEMTDDMAQKLQEDENVLFIEEDILVKANAKKIKKSKETKNKKETKEAGKSAEREWNIQAIQADELGKTNESISEAVKIAVIDSGVNVGGDIDVTDRVNLVPGEENVTPLFEDTTGHGSSIAGIIAANDDNLGITGINPDAEIYSVKVLDDSNSAPVSRVIEGIYWAMDKNVNIISISFGTSTPSAALESAIKDAYNQGILIIAAAGNGGEEGSDNIEYPAAYEEVVTVGSIDSNEKHSTTSSTGDDMEIVAPGELIKSTGGFGGEVVVSGTSMSVPHVVGVASLLWQKDLSCSSDFIRQLLNISANNLGKEELYGNGLVDAAYALEIYDDFKNAYKTETTNGMKENSTELETFDDEKYVEGSWTPNMHDMLVGYGMSVNGVWDAMTIKLVTAGAVYPDKSEKLKNMLYNPQWHGYFMTRDKAMVNYLTCYEYCTLLANGGGETSYTGSGGLSNECAIMDSQISNNGIAGVSWSEIFNGFDIAYDSLSLQAKKDYRKYFLWGMAIHIITDAYAHSTYRYVDGTYNRNDHATDGYADFPYNDYGTLRWEAASTTSKLAIGQFITGGYGDYRQVLEAYESFVPHGTAQPFYFNLLITFADLQSYGRYGYYLSDADRSKLAAVHIQILPQESGAYE